MQPIGYAQHTNNKLIILIFFNNKRSRLLIITEKIDLAVTTVLNVAISSYQKSLTIHIMKTK